MQSAIHFTHFVKLPSFQMQIIKQTQKYFAHQYLLIQYFELEFYSNFSAECLPPRKYTSEIFT